MHERHHATYLKGQGVKSLPFFFCSLNNDSVSFKIGLASFDSVTANNDKALGTISELTNGGASSLADLVALNVIRCSGNNTTDIGATIFSGVGSTARNLYFRPTITQNGVSLNYAIGWLRK